MTVQHESLFVVEMLSSRTQSPTYLKKIMLSSRTQSPTYLNRSNQLTGHYYLTGRSYVRGRTAYQPYLPKRHTYETGKCLRHCRARSKHQRRRSAPPTSACRSTPETRRGPRAGMESRLDGLPAGTTSFETFIFRHRRRHVQCAGMGVPVLKMTTSEHSIPVQRTCHRRCRDRADTPETRRGPRVGTESRLDGLPAGTTSFDIEPIW